MMYTSISIGLEKAEYYTEGPSAHGDDKSSYITQIALPIKFV